MESVMEDVEKDTASYSQPDEYSKLIAVQDRNYDELIPLDELDDPDSLASDGEGHSKFTGNLDDDLL